MTDIYRFRVAKLIRQKFAEKLTDEGVWVCGHNVKEAKELQTLLREKLFEETQEAISATDPQSLLNELGDILEVINALAQTYGYSIQDIEKSRQEKALGRGSLSDGFYCDFVQMSSNNPHFSYYQKNSETYPSVPIV